MLENVFFISNQNLTKVKFKINIINLNSYSTNLV